MCASVTFAVFAVAFRKMEDNGKTDLEKLANACRCTDSARSGALVIRRYKLHKGHESLVYQLGGEIRKRENGRGKRVNCTAPIRI